MTQLHWFKAATRLDSARLVSDLQIQNGGPVPEQSVKAVGFILFISISVLF